jgi:hypothetical protein
MTVMRTLITDVARIGRFLPTAPYQRFAYACATLLVVSGVVHLGVYAVDGGSWAGPISWRKPVVFGLSFGITLATLGWIMGLLRPGKVLGWVVLGTLSVASVGEVALVSMQRWRGVESHFNEDTAFDATVFSMMGSLVSLIGVMVVVMTVWSFFRLDAPGLLSYAIRAGLVLMLVSQVVGVQMIVEGGNTFGAAGALKLPHAFTLHAVQVLPALALMLLAGDASPSRATRAVGLGAVGYALMIAATMVQTYGGHAPLDVGVTSTLLAVAGLFLLIAAVLIGLLGLASRLHPPASPAVGSLGGP